MLQKLLKLRTMSAHELLFRARTRLFLERDRIRHRLFGSELADGAFLARLAFDGGNDRPGAPAEGAERLLRHIRNRSDVRFYFQEADREALVAAAERNWPRLVPEAVRAAEEICRHEFAFLGITCKLGPEISWVADPVSSRAWPMKFHTEIDIFGGTQYGDVKHVWELNRHQFLVVLGKAYWLTGEEKYAAEVFSLMQSWIRQNPPKMGINWTSALEVAVRAISWSWAYQFCLQSRSLDPATNLAILKALYRHGEFIEEHLSFYFSPYNHLIGEATALHAIGALFPEFPRARAWKSTGWDVLEEQAGKQFHPDGFTVEQASFYHHFTLGFYLLAALLRRYNGEPVGRETWDVIERATEISMYLAKPGDGMPMIGDADDARSIYVANPPLWDFRAFYSTGAVLFSRGDMKRIAGEFHEDSLWLLGLEGFREYEALSDEAPSHRSRAFADSGYYVMRTGWNADAHYLSFDCGELASGVPRNDVASAAHGHADALSVEVSSGGRSLLVDPGFFTYNGDPDWHRYFRETAAHNTLVLDGQSQAKLRGRMKWSCAPRTQRHHWMTSTPLDYVDGSHDGYRRMPQPAVHRRSVTFFKPDYWLIRDEVLGAGEHRIDRYFHFAPAEVLCDADSRSARTAWASGPNLAVVSVERDGVSIELEQRGEAPSGGWIASGYGLKTQAPIARYRTRATCPVALHTLLIPYRGEPPEVTVHASALGAARDRMLSIRIGDRRDVVVFSEEPDAIPGRDGWRTDAYASCVRRNAAGEVTACALVGGSILAVADEVLLQLDRRVGWAALSMEDGRPLVEVSEPAGVTTCFTGPRVVVREDGAVAR